MLCKAITFTKNYNYPLRNNTEERSSQLLPVIVWQLNLVRWSEEKTKIRVIFFMTLSSPIGRSGYGPCLRGY
jgi:hypothetical protein